MRELHDWHDIDNPDATDVPEHMVARTAEDDAPYEHQGAFATDTNTVV